MSGSVGNRNLGQATPRRTNAGCRSRERIGAGVVTGTARSPAIPGPSQQSHWEARGLSRRSAYPVRTSLCSVCPLAIHGNPPEDFPPESFALVAFCESCGHQSTLDRDHLPPAVTVQGLRSRLRCSRCRSRSCTLRIVFIGAGGFHYGG